MGWLEPQLRVLSSVVFPKEQRQTQEQEQAH